MKKFPILWSHNHGEVVGRMELMDDAIDSLERVPEVCKFSVGLVTNGIHTGRTDSDYELRHISIVPIQKVVVEAYDFSNIGDQHFAFYRCNVCHGFLHQSYLNPSTTEFELTRPCVDGDCRGTMERK